MKLSFIPHKHKFDIIPTEKLMLKSGNHTVICILRCWCGKKQAGFPSYNTILALREGTKETVEFLNSQGFSLNDDGELVVK